MHGLQKATILWARVWRNRRRQWLLIYDVLSDSSTYSCVDDLVDLSAKICGEVAVVVSFRPFILLSPEPTLFCRRQLPFPSFLHSSLATVIATASCDLLARLLRSAVRKRRLAVRIC